MNERAHWFQLKQINEPTDSVHLTKLFGLIIYADVYMNQQYIYWALLFEELQMILISYFDRYTAVDGKIDNSVEEPSKTLVNCFSCDFTVSIHSVFAC